AGPALTSLTRASMRTFQPGSALAIRASVSRAAFSTAALAERFPSADAFSLSSPNKGEASHQSPQTATAVRREELSIGVLLAVSLLSRGLPLLLVTANRYAPLGAGMHPVFPSASVAQERHGTKLPPIDRRRVVPSTRIAAP